MSFMRRHKGAVVWSLALHVAVVAVVAIGVPWHIERPRVSVASAPIIEGVMIDRAAIEREQAKRDEAARQQRQQQQREERQRREAAEQQRVAEQREQQRVAAEARARDEAARKEQERIAAEKAEQRRRDEQAKAEREAQARREKEEADKRAADQRRRQAAEAELAAQLALEAEQNAAREAGLLDQYIRMIENKIKQEWQRPLSARPGLDCKVSVVQTLTGDVVRVTVGSCNGDDAVRRSIENAVMDASPLPRPPHPSLFERNLNVTFRPEE